jgi:uncharacterized protein (DUF58 family)
MPLRPRAFRRHGVCVTRIGLWAILFILLVAVAATNTGNNALYMVLAVAVSALLLSLLSAVVNVFRIEVELREPGEVFANRPFELDFRAVNTSWFLPRWLVEVGFDDGGEAVVLVHLPSRTTSVKWVDARATMLLPRRGEHRMDRMSISTLFPFGFFRVSRRVDVEETVLVYPEVFSAAHFETELRERFGERSAGRRGPGHELYGLRPLRPGDDPRAIHWKQTARTGRFIFQEREAEDSRRVVIVVDNGVGSLGPSRDERFERLISEAATAALDFVERGWDVGLLTRSQHLPMRGGRLQRQAILESLARLEATPRTREPLHADGAPELHFALDRPLAESSGELRLAQA